MLVRHVAGQHSPAPQVHEADQLEDVERREAGGEEGPHPTAAEGGGSASGFLPPTVRLRLWGSLPRPEELEKPQTGVRPQPSSRGPLARHPELVSPSAPASPPPQPV